MTDQVELSEGMRWAQGYRSPYFMTDSTRKLAELENPYVLIYDRVINDFGIDPNSGACARTRWKPARRR